MGNSKGKAHEEKSLGDVFAGTAVKTFFTLLVGLIIGLALCDFKIRKDLPTWDQLWDQASVHIGNATSASAEPASADSTQTEASLLVNTASLSEDEILPIGLTDVFSDTVVGGIVKCVKRASDDEDDGESLCRGDIIWGDPEHPEKIPYPFQGWCDAASSSNCIKAARILFAEDHSKVVFEKVYVYLNNRRFPHFEGPDGVDLDLRAWKKKIVFQMLEEKVEGR